MSADQTAQQRIGQLAARALDGLEGRTLVGAILMIAVDGAGDTYATASYVPEGQHFVTTLGLVTDWQIDRAAIITASAITADTDEDKDQ